MFDPVDDKTFTRRQALRTITLASAAAWPAVSAANKLRGTAINHVSYSSADYDKTRDFYNHLFGFQVSEEDHQQLYLWAGDAMISAKNTPKVPAPFIDHFGLTVEPWDLGAVEFVLNERGMMARVNRSDPHDTQGKTFFTRDPNGYPLQLCARDAAVKPAPVDSRAPLKAIGINHISYRCTDYKKARDFYADLLGVPVSDDDGKQAYLWFGDAFMVVRSGETLNGRPVIDHFAWNLADWDPDRVAMELKKRGLEAQADSSGKSILTKDLNGYSLQLCSEDLAKKP